MSAVAGVIQSDFVNPLIVDPGVLTGREMWRRVDETRKQEITSFQFRVRDPFGNRPADLLSSFELYRPLRLLLHDGGAAGYDRAMRDVLHAEIDQITSSQLRSDGQVK